MDAAEHLRTAQHIHLQLRRELGHAIDLVRMLTEPRYARDVLFVCDALRDTPLPALAKTFRAGQAFAQAEQAADPQAHHTAPRRSNALPSATWSPTP